MKHPFTATTSVLIDAPASKVWEALVTPSMVKQYLFGTNVVSDWKVGSPITYSGEWEWKPYEDKWTILEFVPEKRMVTTYWSGFSGLPDLPENYQEVSYILSEKDGGTQLTVTQDNVASQEAADHSQQSWGAVLQSIKKMLES